MIYTFTPTPPRPGEAPQDYAQRIFDDLTKALREAQPLMMLKVLSVAPPKPRDGMVVFADGTNWNPGAGAGVYARVGGAWAKLN